MTHTAEITEAENVLCNHYISVVSDMFVFTDTQTLRVFLSLTSCLLSRERGGSGQVSDDSHTEEFLDEREEPLSRSYFTQKSKQKSAVIFAAK